jgi:hypothetical protein
VELKPSPFCNEQLVFEQEVYSVTLTKGNSTKVPTTINLFTKREYARKFIADAFPYFRPMPSSQASGNGELGTVYYHHGMTLRIQKIPVGFGIYQWLLGSEHYQSPISAISERYSPMSTVTTA